MVHSEPITMRVSVYGQRHRSCRARDGPFENGFAARYAGAVAAKPSAKKIRIGRLYLSGTDPQIDKAVDEALAQGHFQVIALNQAFKAKWDQAETATVVAAGAWISDRKYFGKSDVSARTKAIIALGQFQYTANYQKALERQAKWQHALGQVFEKVDFIALPTLQEAAAKNSTLRRRGRF
jgi:amidase